MKSRTLLISGLLLIGLIISPTNAGAGHCPAFTSSMIDTAILATEYNQEEPIEGFAEDYPAEPYIFCVFYNEDWGYFSVFVGFYEDEEREGNEAYVFGRSPIWRDTILQTHVYGLSKAEMRACRAQVTASFVWKKYCKPLIE
jgi:hypothetical protein